MNVFDQSELVHYRWHPHNPCLNMGTFNKSWLKDVTVLLPIRIAAQYKHKFAYFAYIIECAQGDQPARCPNQFFAVNEPSAVPWW